MVCKKAFKNRLLAWLFVLLFCFMFSFPVEASGLIEDTWDGVVDVQINDSNVYLDLSEKIYENLTESTIAPAASNAIYEGSINAYLKFDNLQVGSYLDGTIIKRLKVTVINYHEHCTVYSLQVSSDPLVLGNGIIVFPYQYNEHYGELIMDVYVDFDSYGINSSELIIPFVLDFDLGCFFYQSDIVSIPPTMGLHVDVIEDYGGVLYQYDDLKDIDSVDGSFAGQNEQIISGQKEQMQQQHQDSLAEQELQQEANTLQEEANETQKNIFDKIADFFDNFFSRLGDFLLGLIVPSAEELTAFLDEVNDWFGERLGFIWYPFSFAVDMVSALANGTADTGFQVPEFRLNILGTEYQIWGGMTVDLDAFGIFKYVRIFTSFLLVGGIVMLAYDKWDEWIGGHGVG